MSRPLIYFLVAFLANVSAIFAAATTNILYTRPATLDTNALNDSIHRLRMGTLLIEAAPNTEIQIQQLRHEFWFGAALANHLFGPRADAATAAKYKQTFLENFNAAVTENALKWHQLEPERGKINYTTVDAILEWTEQNKIPLRGHNVFWGIPQFVPQWQKDLDNDTLREVVKNHATEIARKYRGRFAEYDLNNEMVHGNFYEQRLGPEITKQMADSMRAEDTNAVLFLNDYDMLTGRRVRDYVAQIQKFRDQQVSLGGIGVQGHSHRDSFDPTVMQNALDQLAQFKLPIRITEFNFPGQNSRHYNKHDDKLTDEEEQAKAQAITDYYRICFAHPNVEGILMWGFWEGANWIPVSSLYRRDWTPTPAAQAYKDLIYKEWWTSEKIKTDSTGHATVKAYYGEHRLTSGSKQLTITLKKSEGQKQISLR
jgi:endo-1,4-beta-xylanase